MRSHERPPFILCFAGDMSGCGFHRMAVPLMSLAMSGYAEGRIDVNAWPIEMIEAIGPDTVVFQRWIDPNQVALMETIRERLPNVMLVYELDDYLGEIPPASYHAGFMPPDLPAKIKVAAQVCDRVTTTTGPMAEWFRGELGCSDVRVVPNAVPAQAVRPRPARTSGRLRVGFAGGISHGGDLELIRPAMAEIGDEVEWVFFGMQPKDPPVRVEFHPGVMPQDYQTKLLQLDLDLVLAPLESNRFNRCKSNLRLIEAGMTGACAIVQWLEPYVDGDPPVFHYAESPEDWTKAISVFVNSAPEARQHSADRLQQWVLATHTLEGLMPARVDAWIKKDATAKAWVPGPVHKRLEDTVLALSSGQPPRFLRNAGRKHSLEDACRLAVSLGADLLWLRSGTVFDETGWHAMRGTLMQGDKVGAVVPLASDGPNAFPRDGHWTPMSADLVTAITASLRTMLPGRRLAVAAPSGPCILLSARALADVGIPDPVGCGGNEEQSLMEWGLRALARGWRTMQAADAYAASESVPIAPSHAAGQRLQLRGYGNALGNLPVENLSKQERLDVELDMLRMRWAGPQPGMAGFGHDYASWSALKGDVPDPDYEKAAAASLFVAVFGAKDITSEWVVFIDDTVDWRVNGLATLRAACASAPDDVLVVYGDNEFRNTEGHVYPDFKPDFDLELFLARDYVTPICAVRVGYMSYTVGIPQNRTSLYSHVLAVAETHGAKAFQHIPEPLVIVREATPEELAMSALNRQMAIEHRYGDAIDVSAHPMLPGALAVKRKWDVDNCAPLVSIIIPTLGAGRLIQPCVNTIRQHTRYPNFEIIVMQNGPERDWPELGAAQNDPRVSTVHWAAPDGKFNWSGCMNEAVRHINGEYLCFVNDDVQFGTEYWLDAMMGHAIRPDVGAVGARLIHPAGIVQHVGVVVHQGIAGHLLKGLPNGQAGNGWLAMLNHEAQAVTGACMLVSRANFSRAGGFDDKVFPLNYGDTDFCMKLRKLGLRNVVEMSAELLHPEGTSRTNPNDQANTLKQLADDNVRFAARWPDADPYWHPCLAVATAQGGATISGLNRDMLLWDEKRPRLDTVRVLTINDMPGASGQSVARMRVGQTVFCGVLDGFMLRLAAPAPANLDGWDIRRPKEIAAGLKRLGIDRIVLRSLIGAAGPAPPVEALRCLAALGIPVSIDPIDPMLVAPWLSEQPDKAAELFGFGSDLGAWKAAYEEIVPAIMEAAE